MLLSSPFYGWWEWSTEKWSPLLRLHWHVEESVVTPGQSHLRVPYFVCHYAVLRLHKSKIEKRCLWLEWRGGQSWPYHKIFDWNDRSRPTATLQWIAQLGQGRGEEMGDAFRYSQISSCWEAWLWEIKFESVPRKKYASGTLVRAGNVGRLQRLGVNSI